MQLEFIDCACGSEISRTENEFWGECQKCRIVYLQSSKFPGKHRPNPHERMSMASMETKRHGSSRSRTQLRESRVASGYSTLVEVDGERHRILEQV